MLRNGPTVAQYNVSPDFRIASISLRVPPIKDYDQAWLIDNFKDTFLLLEDNYRGKVNFFEHDHICYFVKADETFSWQSFFRDFHSAYLKITDDMSPIGVPNLEAPLHYPAKPINLIESFHFSPNFKWVRVQLASFPSMPFLDVADMFKSMLREVDLEWDLLHSVQCHGNVQVQDNSVYFTRKKDEAFSWEKHLPLLAFKCHLPFSAALVTGEALRFPQTRLPDSKPLFPPPLSCELWSRSVVLGQPSTVGIFADRGNPISEEEQYKNNGLQM